MTAWLTKVSPFFHESILRDSPAALLVLAHWVLLVDRAQRCGSWFLSGVADAIVQAVRVRLSHENEVVQGLLEGLLPCNFMTFPQFE